MKKPWFLVHKFRFKGVYGIAEFQHPEEVVSYLIVGEKSAILWDTGLGIADISVPVRKITMLPVTVVNSHSHYDHVGGNCLFSPILKPTEGAVIECLPYCFRVIATPGHSADSVCLYDEKKGLLFVGDTLYDGPLYLQLPESNLAHYMHSLQKLRKLPKVTHIFPSHNGFKFDTARLDDVRRVVSAVLHNPDKYRTVEEMSIKGRLRLKLR